MIIRHTDRNGRWLDHEEPVDIVKIEGDDVVSAVVPSRRLHEVTVVSARKGTEQTSFEFLLIICFVLTQNNFKRYMYINQTLKTMSLLPGF